MKDVYSGWLRLGVFFFRRDVAVFAFGAMRVDGFLIAGGVLVFRLVDIFEWGLDSASRDS